MAEASTPRVKRSLSCSTSFAPTATQVILDSVILRALIGLPV